MPKITIGKNTYIGPDKFDQLTSKQLLHFCALSVKGKTRREILRALSYRLTGAPAYVYFKMNELQRIQLEDTYDWIFQDITTRTNKIPCFKHSGVIYYGYGNNLENITVKEWMVADAAAQRYQKNKNDADLNTFLAATYRPQRSDGKNYGDIREPFEEEKCKAREPLFSSIPAPLKMAIFINYAGVRAETVKDFPNVFKGAGAGKNFGMPGMVHDMAGPELGTVKEIEEQWMIRNLFFIAEKNEIRRMEAKAS